MFRIRKEPDGVILICHDCPHVEHIDAFDENVGSRRTQAARAMQSHSYHEHGAGSVLKPVPKEDPLIIDKQEGVSGSDWSNCLN